MSDLFYRTASISEPDEDKRIARVSFSSEHPVRRYMGQEVLLHGEKNVDLGYLNDVGSVLKRHGGGMSDIVGPIHKAWVDDRVGVADIGFDDDENGNMALSKIKSKSLRGISFGYRIEKGRRLEDDRDVWVDPDTKIEYRGPAIIGTFWRAHEITLTPVPADHTVGFNRQLVENINFENLKRQVQEDSRMDENDKKEVGLIVADALKAAGIGARSTEQTLTADDIRSIVTDTIKDVTTPKIQFSRDVMSGLLGRAAAVSDECKSKATDMSLDGKSEVEILRMINDTAVGGEGDTEHRRSAGDEGHEDGKAGDTKYRKVDDIPDDLFASAFGAA